MITVTVWKFFKLDFYRTNTNGGIEVLTFPDGSFQKFPSDTYKEVIDKVSRGLDTGADFAIIEPIYKLKACIPLERIKEGLSPSEERRSNFAWILLAFGQCENYDYIKEKLKCDYYLNELKLVEENELESILEKESQFTTIHQYIKVEDVARFYEHNQAKTLYSLDNQDFQQKRIPIEKQMAQLQKEYKVLKAECDRLNELERQMGITPLSKPPLGFMPDYILNEME